MPPREKVTVVGRRLDPADHALRDLLTRTAQPYHWLEAGSPQAEAVLARHGAGPDDLPLLVERDAVLRGATVPALIEAWDLAQPPSRAAYDLIIVGAGPAGLAAAVYGSSDGLTTLLVERDVPGGQASHTSRIENFFGFPGGIGGAEIARLAGRQAEGFGTDIAMLGGVTSSSRDADGTFRVQLAGGHGVRAPIVVAAPGMEWRRLEVDGFDALLGRGTYYGAGRSEARHCRDEPVVVVGAGNSAGQAVMDLGDAGARVLMAVRGDTLSRTMSAYLVQRIEAHPGIEVRFGTEVVGVQEGDGRLVAVRLGTESGSRPATALFACIGGTPRTGWAVDVGVATDPSGFVLTGPDLLDAGRRPDGWPLDRDPLALETSVPGFFVAGDVRSGSTKRVGAAVGEGAMAVALAHRRLSELG